jgi:hypothetical protein
MANYLRAFVIGSSFFVFILFFIAVYNIIRSGKMNYNYYEYTIIAPIGLGFVTMAALWLSENFNISKRMAYLIISVLAPIVVLSYVYLTNTYNYTLDDWMEHIFYMYIFYLIIFNFIVYQLDKYV